jgi:hypothetical protein
MSLAREVINPSESGVDTDTRAGKLALQRAMLESGIDRIHTAAEHTLGTVRRTHGLEGERFSISTGVVALRASTERQPATFGRLTFSFGKYEKGGEPRRDVYTVSVEVGGDTTIVPEKFDPAAPENVAYRHEKTVGGQEVIINWQHRDGTGDYVLVSAVNATEPLSGDELLAAQFQLNTMENRINHIGSAILNSELNPHFINCE